MSGIPFSNIPSNLRIPGFRAEVSNAAANTATAIQRGLVIGQKISAGTGTASVPQLCMGPAHADAVGGIGSMLALMARTYIQNDPFGELWLLPLADDGDATAATGSINFTATPTAAGILSLYVAGVLIPVNITATMNASDVAAAVGVAVAATTGLPVSVGVDGSGVDFTALNGGLCGNDIDIRMNYLGAQAGEYTPTGLTYDITAMASGAINPSLTAGLAALGDKTFDFIALPYTDATSLAAVDAFLGDTAGRWNWSQQLFGGYFCAYRATGSDLVTEGNTRNGQHGSMMGYNDSPTPSFIWAAAYAGQAGAALRNDAARPLHTLPLVGVKAPPIQSRFRITQRNTLLFNGISTFTVADDGTVQLEGTITLYQKNASSVPDNSYLQINTMYNLMFVLRSLMSLFSSKYARVKLAANGTRFAPGSAIVTPNIIKADLIAKYRELEFDGFTQASAAFAAGLIVVQNTTNPNRVDVLFPAILIDQLDIMALLAEFRLAA